MVGQIARDRPSVIFTSMTVAPRRHSATKSHSLRFPAWTMRFGYRWTRPGSRLSSARASSSPRMPEETSVAAYFAPRARRLRCREISTGREIISRISASSIQPCVCASKRTLSVSFSGGNHHGALAAQIPQQTGGTITARNAKYFCRRRRACSFCVCPSLPEWKVAINSSCSYVFGFDS